MWLRRLLARHLDRFESSVPPDGKQSCSAVQGSTGQHRAIQGNPTRLLTHPAISWCAADGRPAPWRSARSTQASDWLVHLISSPTTTVETPSSPTPDPTYNKSLQSGGSFFLFQLAPPAPIDHFLWTLSYHVRLGRRPQLWHSCASPSSPRGQRYGQQRSHHHHPGCPGLGLGYPSSCCCTCPAPWASSLGSLAFAHSLRLKWLPSPCIVHHAPWPADSIGLCHLLRTCTYPCTSISVVVEMLVG